MPPPYSASGTCAGSASSARPRNARRTSRPFDQPCCRTPPCSTGAYSCACGPVSGVWCISLHKRVYVSLNQHPLSRTHRCRKILGKRPAEDSASSIECLAKVSAHHGSPLSGAKITRTKFFLLAWCWVNKRVPAAAARFAGVHPHTVYKWYDRFRMAAGDVCLRLGPTIWAGSEKLGGPGKTVQVRW